MLVVVLVTESILPCTNWVVSDTILDIPPAAPLIELFKALKFITALLIAPDTACCPVAVRVKKYVLAIETVLLTVAVIALSVFIFKLKLLTVAWTTLNNFVKLKISLKVVVEVTGVVVTARVNARVGLKETAKAFNATVWEVVPVLAVVRPAVALVSSTTKNPVWVLVLFCDALKVVLAGAVHVLCVALVPRAPPYILNTKSLATVVVIVGVLTVVADAVATAEITSETLVPL